MIGEKCVAGGERISILFEGSLFSKIRGPERYGPLLQTIKKKMPVMKYSMMYSAISTADRRDADP